MSESARPNPRSIRHKRILDLAAENPDASLEDLAAELPSVTPDLVERVLDEYGDPADEDDTDSMTDKPEVTEKQQRTLQVIHDHPEATQREIADLLDVSTATVSNRVNSIEGFDWQTRTEFTNTVFGADESSDTAANEDDSVESDDSLDTPENLSADDSIERDAAPVTNSALLAETGVVELEETLSEIEERLASIEAILQDGASGDESAFRDPDLVHKLVHALVESEDITKEEELRVLEDLLT